MNITYGPGLMAKGTNCILKLLLTLSVDLKYMLDKVEEIHFLVLRYCKKPATICEPVIIFKLFGKRINMFKPILIKLTNCIIFCRITVMTAETIHIISYYTSCRQIKAIHHKIISLLERTLLFYSEWGN